MAELKIGTLNCQGQTKIPLAKQLQIQKHLMLYNLDILNCQETYLDEEAFTKCDYVHNNYLIIRNNAMNEFGTACFVRNFFVIRYVSFNTEVHIIVFNTGSLTIFIQNLGLMQKAVDLGKICFQLLSRT